MTTEIELHKLLPSYATLPFSFETVIDRREGVEWFQRNWTTSFFYVTAYLFVIFGLSLWMEGRKRFEVKNALIWWNLGLAVFSAAGSIRMLPELLSILGEEDGYHKSVCDSR